MNQVTGSNGTAVEAKRSGGSLIDSASREDSRPVRGVPPRDDMAAIRNGASPESARRMRKGRRLANLAMFARQLYVLISCGTPILQSISALERQASDQAWRAVLRDIRNHVEQGLSLSASMALHPDCFDAVTRTLVAVGESSGRLSDMLDRIARITMERLEIRRSVIGALIYPCLLLSIAFGALMVVMIVVLPSFAGLFASLDVPLPPTTELLLSCSNVLMAYWWAVLAGIALAVTGGVVFVRSAEGKRIADRTILRLPKFGQLVQSFATGRIVRLLGLLVESHVPLLEAIRLTRGSVGNSQYVNLLEHAEQSVERGELLSDSLAQGSLIQPSICEAIHSGEQTGQLGPLLMNMADFLDSDNKTAIGAITTLIEPIILIMLGVLIGFIAVSLFLPLFDLTAMTQGGG